MRATRYLYLIIMVFLSSTAQADPGNNMDLKKIMQGLRSDTVLILDALLIDDFDSVIDASSRIADHPNIPASQVSLVAAELGTEMNAFKHFDTLVHDLSLSINSAAHEKDRNRAFADYQQMLSGCMACHASFRQRVATVLNPTSVGE
jgi:hypothetical protein